MSEPKEDIDILSQKELEDGEIEEELDEPEIISINDNESSIVNDDSDVDVDDKNNLKFKKHKHHKKGVHRKRHIEPEDNFDNSWKKSKKCNDAFDDGGSSPEIIEYKSNKNNIFDTFEAEASCKEKLSNNFDDNDIVVAKRWDYNESDEEVNTPCNSNVIESRNVCSELQNNNCLSSPVYEPTSCDQDISIPKENHEVSKWNDYDSDDETNVSSTCNKTENKKNSFDEPSCSNWWDNKSNENKGWGNTSNQNNRNRFNNDTDGTKSPSFAKDFNPDSNISSPSNKKDWTSYNSPSYQNDNGGFQKSNDNLGKWGSYDSPEKSFDNRNESPKRNDDYHNKWNNRDSPRRNDDDDDKWNSRDNSRRGNFRRWNSRDGSRRNNFRRGRGGRDGSYRQRDNQRWGSSNNGGSPQRNDGNKSWGYSNNSPQQNDGNKSWGYNNNSPQRNDSKKSWSYNNNNNSPQRNDDDKKWGSYGNNSPQRDNDNNAKWSTYDSPPGNNNKRWGSSNNNSPQRVGEGNDKWGSFDNESPQRENSSSNKPSTDTSPKPSGEQVNACMYDLPQTDKWGSYDSDEETKAPEPKIIEPQFGSSSGNYQDSPKENSDNPKESNSGFGKWGDFDSDEETKPSNNNNNNSEKSEIGGWGQKSNWRSQDGDNDNKGSFNDNRNRGGYNSSWNRNDKNDDGDNDNKGSFNDNRNRGGYNNNWNRNDKNDWNDRGDRNKRWGNRNDNEKRSVCKYFSMGSCHHGDRCTYLHESPNKQAIPQEVKRKELCKFYEHQQCYKRSNCVYMHEEFPCKLFHAGSKMCPSGDSCKYSHAPLNQETKTLLEKYLDEKVDERRDKTGSDWNSIIKKSNEDDDGDDDNNATGFDPPDNFFPDPLPYRYPGVQDMMRFPIRAPWNTMMRFNDISMPVPHQMNFIRGQRFMYQMNPNRMFTRSCRGMVPPNMHDGFANGMPYPMPPIMQPNSKLHPPNSADLQDNFNVSDPYIDNLAQLVVGKDSSSSPKRLVDMLDPNIQCDDGDEFPLLDIESNNSKKNLSSPVVLKSPEAPPGSYAPRTSMNVAQPNVRLGPGPGYGGEQAMLYGGYPAHPGESAMMDYINMSAIHYFHNHQEPMGYDVPWKLVLLDVPVKIPYPLMNIDTQDLPHKYTDPRLKGHPSVLNANSSANEESLMQQNSYDFNSMSSFGSQLSSPNFVTTSSEMSESHTPLNDFLPKSVEPESPMFPLGDEIFSFKNTLDGDDYLKKTTDRSYLQDPRFKRKKVVANSAMDSSEME